MNRLSEAYRYSRPGITRTTTHEDWRYLRSCGWTSGRAWRILRQMRRGVPMAVAVRVVELGLLEQPIQPAWPLAWWAARCECGHAAHAHPYQSGPGNAWWDGCLAVGCDCGTFRQVGS